MSCVFVVPLQHEQLVFKGEGLAAVHYVLVQGAIKLPNLGPALPRSLAKPRRVLGAQHIAIAIIVDLHQLRPPENDHR